MMKKWTWTLSVPVVAATFSAGCIETFKDDCTVSDTCTSGDGDGDGDASTGGAGDGDGDGDNTGGSGDGDGDGDGDTGGSGTGGGGTGGGDGDGDATGGMGGDPNDPCLECEGDTPHCTPDKECVECLTSNHCDGGETPVCNTTLGECVECVLAEECENPELPMCDSSNSCAPGCESADDCTRFGDELDACDAESGACVQCTGEADCDGNVCDPVAHTCTALPAGTESVCEECAYDAQCAPGHVCVEMTYDDPTAGIVGTFCLWEKDADELGAPDGTCGLNSRPYAQEATVTTVDGASATVCRPRTTTCPAILQHATEVTGCETPGDDDDACGAAGFNDGRCRSNGSETMCTYPCGGADLRDCPGGFSCVEGGDRYCSF